MNLRGRMRFAKKCRKKSAGTTMVEVLVAFLVVMIMVGMFSKVVTVSTHLLNQARDTITKTEEFDKNYYKKSIVKTTVKTDLKITLDESRMKTNVKPVELELPSGVYEKYADSDRGITRYSFGIIESGAGK